LSRSYVFALSSVYVDVQLRPSKRLKVFRTHRIIELLQQKSSW